MSISYEHRFDSKDVLDASSAPHDIGGMKRSEQPRRKRKTRPRRRKPRVAGKGKKPAPMIPLPAAWE